MMGKKMHKSIPEEIHLARINKLPRIVSWHVRGLYRIEDHNISDRLVY